MSTLGVLLAAGSTVYYFCRPYSTWVETKSLSENHSQMVGQLRADTTMPRHYQVPFPHFPGARLLLGAYRQAETTSDENDGVTTSRKEGILLVTNANRLEVVSWYSERLSTMRRLDCTDDTFFLDPSFDGTDNCENVTPHASYVSVRVVPSSLQPLIPHDHSIIEIGIVPDA